MADIIPQDDINADNSKDDGKKFDRLYIRESDKEAFSRLLEEDSPFAGKDNKVPFMMAMILGYHNKNRVKLDSRRGYIFEHYLSSDEMDIIKAIAINEVGDLNILINKKEVYTIAEEYAAGGISLLIDKVFSDQYGSYLKKLELEIKEEFDNKDRD